MLKLNEHYVAAIVPDIGELPCPNCKTLVQGPYEGGISLLKNVQAHYKCGACGTLFAIRYHINQQQYRQLVDIQRPRPRRKKVVDTPIYRLADKDGEDCHVTLPTRKPPSDSA